MDFPNSEIIKSLKSLEQDNLVNLILERKVEINKKHLLYLYIGKMPLDQAIFEKDPNATSIFTKETLEMVINEDFPCDKFSKTELLCIFANQNPSLVKAILDLGLFEKIFIIDNIEDFEPNMLNLKKGSDISFELLEKKTLKKQIFIKYLLNEKGGVNSRYVDHLDKCQNLMNPEKIKVKSNFPEFLLNVEKPLLQKIMNKFNLKKFIFYVYDQCNTSSMTLHQIDNIILINGNFIDAKILNLIMDNYYKCKDKNGAWIKKAFQSADYYFSNYDVAKWIAKNRNLYETSKYSKIKEFHMFTSDNERIYDFFNEESIFIENLVIFTSLVKYLEKTIPTADCEENDHLILCNMVEYVLKNRNLPEFEMVANHPEKWLFLLYNNVELEFMSQETLTENFAIHLKFKEYDIKTVVKELITAKNWDDFEDFKQKVSRKEIKIDDILNLNLPTIGDLLKSVGISKGLVECCICMEVGRKDLYMFYHCSHIICKPCIKKYMRSRNFKNLAISEKDNALRVYFEVEGRKSLPCPNCKKESISIRHEEYIYFLRIFV